MDAMQVVLYGSIASDFLNKAADDTKNKRSVLSYLRGEQKDGSANREDQDFYAQIVLELEDTGTQTHSCIGVTFEVGHADQDLRKYYFFSHAGKFPEDEKGLRALPGVGEYTAGAVLSIAFGKRAPAVDGNVLRVMSRLTADPSPVSDPAYKAYLSERLKEIYPPEGEGCSAFTQSLMELGALVCKPLSPDCPVCPLRSLCRAAERGEQGNFPVLPEKKQKRREDIFVFLIRTPDGIAVRKRTSGVLKGMYEFPSLPASDKSPEQILSEWGMSAFTVGSSRKYTHIFTHIRWEMIAFPVRAPAAPFEIYPEGDIEAKISLPTAFRQCLNCLPEENGAGRGEPSAKSKRRAADRTEDETDEKRTKTKHAGKEKEI